MSEHVHEFRDADDAPISIDLTRVVAVSRREGATVVETVCDMGSARTYNLSSNYDDVSRLWRAAKADSIVTSTHFQQLGSLVESVKSLVQREHRREQALLDMHGSVKELSQQVSRLTSAVSSLETTRR